MNILHILRTIHTDHSARGIWIHGDTVFCLSLEDVVRESGVKVPGRTAIPAGLYEIKLEDSPKFGKDTPTLQNVPDFDCIRIHGGNTEQDTEGCILVGFQAAAADRIFDSAVKPLTEIIKSIIATYGECFVEIHNGHPGYGVKA
jgi:hypothetical protein